MEVHNYDNTEHNMKFIDETMGRDFTEMMKWEFRIKGRALTFEEFCSIYDNELTEEEATEDYRGYQDLAKFFTDLHAACVARAQASSDWLINFGERQALCERLTWEEFISLCDSYLDDRKRAAIGAPDECLDVPLLDDLVKTYISSSKYHDGRGIESYQMIGLKFDHLFDRYREEELGEWVQGDTERDY